MFHGLITGDEKREEDESLSDDDREEKKKHQGTVCVLSGSGRFFDRRKSFFYPKKIDIIRNLTNPW